MQETISRTCRTFHRKHIRVSPPEAHGASGEMWSRSYQLQPVPGTKISRNICNSCFFLRNIKVTRVVTLVTRVVFGKVSMIDHPGPWDWCGWKWAPSRTTWWWINLQRPQRPESNKNRLLEVLLETLNRMIKFIEVWDQMAQTYHVFVAWW